MSPSGKRGILKSQTVARGETNGPSKREKNLVAACHSFAALQLLTCVFLRRSHPQPAGASHSGTASPAPDASAHDSLLDEETFSRKAQCVVEDFLSGNQVPYRLGLFDVNEDGMPEVMVQDYVGRAAGCILYNLTDPDPVETAIRLNWPATSVDTVYIQRSEAGIKWRVEGDDSHGFTDTTRNEIVEIESGEVKTIDCELTYILGDDKEPCSLSVRTVINKEEAESLNFSLEGLPAGETDELLAGSLYQLYIRQDWEPLSSPPWVLEETTTIGPDQLQNRISKLYREWSRSH